MQVTYNSKKIPILGKLARKLAHKKGSQKILDDRTLSPSISSGSVVLLTGATFDSFEVELQSVITSEIAEDSILSLSHIDDTATDVSSSMSEQDDDSLSRMSDSSQTSSDASTLAKDAETSRRHGQRASLKSSRDSAHQWNPSFLRCLVDDEESWLSRGYAIQRSPSSSHLSTDSQNTFDKSLFSHTSDGSNGFQVRCFD